MLIHYELLSPTPPRRSTQYLLSSLALPVWGITAKNNFFEAHAKKGAELVEDVRGEFRSAVEGHTERDAML